MTVADASGREYIYKGTKDLQPRPGQVDDKGRPIYGYLPDDALVNAVNLAIYLKRPLLIKGEPGCGKTRLARAVADELGLDYESWYIKSTSRARDGLYTYDTLARLQDAQMHQDIGNHDKYIRKGALGRAFEGKDRTVVLIDEIDKADIDFPNDLLLELEDFSFVIPEKDDERVEARPGKEPIIFITSNDEKDLPDAFLRRCLFHYINFPDADRLTEIIDIHCPGVAETIKKMAIRRFVELREKMTDDKKAGGKKVSTSELIDWVNALQFDARRSSEREVLDRLNMALLPDASALLKSKEDQHYQELKTPGAGS